MIPTLLLAATLSLPFNDVRAVSTTNGTSTLIAWTNEFGYSPLAYRVFIRLADSSLDRKGIELASGFNPRVATNGREYLVGWSVRFSRFSAFIGPNTVVQVISADGVPGVRKVLNHSAIGGVTNIAWNGTHWIVAYYAQQAARVTLLDEGLNVIATIDAGAGAPVALEHIGGRWWAFRSDAASTEAIEVRGDGSAGAHFTVPIATARLFRASDDLLLFQHDHDIDAMTFDPLHGFGVTRPFLAQSIALDAMPFADGTLLLITHTGDPRYDLVSIDAAGEIHTQLPLYSASELRMPYATLGASKNGPQFFFSPASVEQWATGAIDLYRYRINAIAPLDPNAAERVSEIELETRRRAARH